MYIWYSWQLSYKSTVGKSRGLQAIANFYLVTQVYPSQGNSKLQLQDGLYTILAL